MYVCIYIFIIVYFIIHLYKQLLILTCNLMPQNTFQGRQLSHYGHHYLKKNKTIK